MSARRMSGIPGIFLLVSGLLICNSVFAIQSGQVDDFEDGTTQGWREGGPSSNPPVATNSDAPLRGGEYSLEDQSSGGGGPGSRWVMFNTDARWQGDYVAAGIAEIRMWVQVRAGNPDANIRVGFQSSSGARLVSTDAVVVSCCSDWNLVILPIGPGDLTLVSGGGTYNSNMSDVTTMRIIDSATAQWQGDARVQHIAVDNIRALGEPSIFAGWIWENGAYGLPDTYLSEESCFGPIFLNIASDDQFIAGGSEVCWGRTTAGGNPARAYDEYDGMNFLFLDIIEGFSSEPLVGAGGNLLEAFAFGDSDIPERVATILAEPSDSDLLILGGYDQQVFEGFPFVYMLAKTSQDIFENRVASDVEGRWRLSLFDRSISLDDVNVETVLASIFTVDLQANGNCDFVESLVFQDQDFDTNGEVFFATQFDLDGVDLTNRGVEAGIADGVVTNCSYELDTDQLLSLSFTLTDSTGANPWNLRYFVSDDNNYAVSAPHPDGPEDESTSLQVAYRTASAFNVNEMDGDYLFYFNATEYEATGTAHSTGRTGLQEFDFQGRGMLSFDSNQPGTVPAGQAGNWFACEIDMVENEFADGVDGEPAMGTVSGSIDVDSEYTPFTGCDYSVAADGALLLNVEVTDPGESPEEVLFAGYANDNGELITLVDFQSDPPPSAGLEDIGGVRHIVAMKYTGDPGADEDLDSFTNLEEFQLPLPLPPPPPVQAVLTLPDIGDSAAPEIGVVLSGSLNAYVRDASTDEPIMDLTFNANRTPLDTGVADINGSPAIAVLFEDESGRAWVEVRDALTDTLIRDVWFSSGYTPLALAVLPDLNGNSTSEVAVLMTKDSDGRAWVHIKDASTLAYVNNVYFPAGYTPLDVEFVPDVDGNPGAEVAVLMTRNSDGRTWVQVRDANTGTYVRNVWFPGGYTPKDLAVIDNLSGYPLIRIDDFEDGTTQGWTEGGPSPNPPSNIADGGPDGAGDNYLENASTGGAGPGSRQVMFNTTTWAGDYIAAGIQAIRVQAKVIAGGSANLRVAFQSVTGTRFASTTAVVVPNDGNWHNVFLPILEADMTLVSGADTYTAAMSNVTQMRVMSAAAPSWQGDSVAMTLGFDDITAVPGADLAVLFVRDSDNRTWVHMKDTVTGAYVKNVWFSAGFTPTRLEIVPDLDTNPGDELAVLTTKDTDGRAWVLVKDALSGAAIRNVWFQGSFAPKDFAVLPEIDANAGAELAVLGEKTGGQMQVEIKDTKTNAFINRVDIP